jgi:hypothetical protein
VPPERLRASAFESTGLIPAPNPPTPRGRACKRQAEQWLRRIPTVAQLITYKKKWIVSVAALLYRLWKLRVVSDWQYRSMCIQIADFRTNEPEPAERETSQVLRKVFDSLRTEGLMKSDVARELKIHPRQIEELAFGMIVSENASPPDSDRSARQRPHLRLVK